MSRKIGDARQGRAPPGARRGRSAGL